MASVAAAVLLLGSCSAPQGAPEPSGLTSRIDARPEAGFHWPYYFFISDELVDAARSGRTIPILVFPNNTGTPDDDFEVHERSVLNQLSWNRPVADMLGAALLVPVFPRPRSNLGIYTHALDRDALLTELDGLSRLDLQLIAMIDDAIFRWSSDGVQINSKVVVMGFSASGMFANRFAILHPDRVAAAAVGSPGGWPIAPLAEWNGCPLRYPVGVADLAQLTGEKFDASTYIAIPHLFFLGDQDENDSVPYDDGYDDEDEKLVFELFGSTPVERWPVAEKVYEASGANAEFRLYPGLGHELPQWVTEDALAFLREALAEKPPAGD